MGKIKGKRKNIANTKNKKVKKDKAKSS